MAAMNPSGLDLSVSTSERPNEVAAFNWPAATAASAQSTTHNIARDSVNTKIIIRRLFDALNHANVAYCHWKSNIRIDGTLAGVEDIDLLVRRRDFDRFQTVILAVGFKLVQLHSGVGHPGIFNALALDEATGELVHLHAHYQIVGGDSLVKNYRFLIEDLLLQDTRIVHGVKVPVAEADLLLFLLRVGLKHTSLIEILKVNLHYGKVLAELKWLLENADVAKTEALLRDWLPVIQPELLLNLLSAVDDRSALLRRVVLGRRIAWGLRDFRRLGSVRAFFSRQWRLFMYAICRFQRRRDFVPIAGGLVVALVGPKASGKSTIGSHLAVGLDGTWSLPVYTPGSLRPPLFRRCLGFLCQLRAKCFLTNAWGNMRSLKGAWQKPIRCFMCSVCFCWHMIGGNCCLGPTCGHCG